jgi:hypothetical protein
MKQILILYGLALVMYSLSLILHELRIRALEKLAQRMIMVAKMTLACEALAKTKKEDK